MAPSKQQQQLRRSSSDHQRSIASFFTSSPASQSPALPSKKPLLVVGPPSSSSKPPLTENAQVCTPCAPSSPRKQPQGCAADELPDPASLVGKRVRVYWPLDQTWYEGQVKGYQRSSGGCLHVVKYDDGDEESIDLTKEKVEWLTSAKPAHRRLRKLSSSMMDSQGATSCESGESRSLKRSLPPSQTTSTSVEDSHGGSNRSKRSRRKVVYAAGDSGEEEDEKDEEWAEMSQETEELDDVEFEGNVSTEPRKGRKRGRAVKDTGEGDSLNDVSAVGSKACSRKLFGNRRKGAKHSLESFVVHERGDTSNASCNRQKDNSPELEVHLTGEAAERFGHRDSDKFRFLHKDRKDACGKRPGDLEYDPRSLHLPTEFLKGLSAGQRQWWEFKSKHMDKVILFKMGKFYEMFEMDAHIGAQKLDLQYMKGDQPHCGFPEKNFEDNAGKLARLGYRVLVVEQTETPGQLEQRNIKSGTKDKVVKREICAVITKGTMTEGEMLGSTPDAAYLMAVFEIPDNASVDGSSVIGLCFVDTATSRFMLGQFLDDMARSRLRSILAELRPVELVKPRGMLAGVTEKVLKDQTRNAVVTNLTPGLEFWDSKKTMDEVVTMYWDRAKDKDGNCKEDIDIKESIHVLPIFLRSLTNAGGKGEAAICALGGCISYLRQALLDQTLLSCGRFELLPGSDLFLELPPREMPVSNKSSKESAALPFSFSGDYSEPHMELDSSAMENLDILENSHDGGTSGTLLAQLDHCVTAFGRRLLKRWVVRPLLRVMSIVERQHAVEDMKGVSADAAGKFRKDIARLPDMERLVVRLHAWSEKSGRNAQAVILYEDAAKKLLKEFIATLRGFQIIVQVLSLFMNIKKQFSSSSLQQLLSSEEGVPNLTPLLQYFEAAFDWSDAEKTGHISPREGVDADFDSGSASVSEIEAKLQVYLEEQQKHFENQSDITYVTVGKDRYQIEVPDALQRKVPPDYEVVSQRKGFRRYSTSRVRELLRELVGREDRKERSLKNILQGLVKRFCENYASWLFAVQTVAELDALISLSMASISMIGGTCKPVLSNSSKDSSPFVLAKSLRHPILVNSLDGGHLFVPNDVRLGGKGQAPFMLLTGPNMGGKSTLLRQVCLAIILAQVGADVPAESFQCSPVDRIFVRMGAKDHIMTGQSTFLVELLETASMLTSATRDSLVALDELGRGTATSDGQAIAHAVLEHLAHKVGCRGLFSTHYHRLANDHANDPTVALYHMACAVEASSDGVDKVTFLYKLAHGSCPKSYGVNVARIAGMPEPVLKRAASRSNEVEILDSIVAARGSAGHLFFESMFVEVLQLLRNMLSTSPPDKAIMDSLCRQLEKINGTLKYS